ncbi:MAG: TolC family protein [Phenylobacterium sp.]|uniref:efflux transporter outer membrane subunit n=1 Tax=Phenylobacterium sp. TaxID=1871053 RepID=UPI001A391344|nr:TolC family protein [Phenylobacterium sp.]MBL8555458.1 TolC family protein [Phenylobacterium sp.]
MRLHTVLLAAGIALAGCATPRDADVRLPGAYEAAAEAPAGAIPLDTWWTAYSDAQLTELVQQALERNTDVRTARSRLDEVKAQRTGAILQYLPQGDLNAAGRRADTKQIGGTVANIPGFSTSGVSEQYSANFNVSWEVDPWGRGFVAYRAADAEVDRVRFAYEAARAQIAAQTADAYFQAKGLAIQLADARETARIQQGLYDLASKRAVAGLAATAEPDRIAGDLAQARANVEALDAQLQIQKRAILILAGRVFEPTANVAATPDVGEAPGVPASLPSDLLQRRPDVRQAQAAVRSAAAQQKLAGLAFFPSFSLTPGLGWSRIEQPGFSSETTSWTIGGSVMQPLLSIPRLMSDLKVQNARTEQAVTAYEKTVQTAFQEAESSLVGLDADRRRVALLRDGEVRARRAFEAARIGYERGLTDLNTTLSSEQAWRAVRAQLTSAEVQALRRSVQAVKAIGGGWPAQKYAQARPEAAR